jgi:hypothetical protein
METKCSKPKRLVLRIKEALKQAAILTHQTRTKKKNDFSN